MLIQMTVIDVCYYTVKLCFLSSHMGNVASKLKDFVNQHDMKITCMICLIIYKGKKAGQSDEPNHSKLNKNITGDSAVAKRHR